MTTHLPGRGSALLVLAFIFFAACSNDPDDDSPDSGTDPAADVGSDTVEAPDAVDATDATEFDGGGGDVSASNPEPCDPIGQDCVEPSASACGLRLENDTFAGFSCREGLGTAELSESCERPNGLPGEDTCAGGLYCSHWGEPQTVPQERVCLAYCSPDTPCAVGTSCLGFDQEGTYGLCAPACDPIDDQCPEGTKCGHYLSSIGSGPIWICDFDADAGVGDACASSSDCGSGQMCAGSDNRTCRELCHDDAPCPGASSCLLFGPLGSCLAIDWSCVGSVTTLPPEGAESSVEVHVVSEKYIDVGGAVVTACPADDVDCGAPIDTQTTGADGLAILTVPTGADGFDGFFEITAAGHSPGLVYGSAPFTQLTSSVRAELFSANLGDHWAGDLTIAPDRGSLVASVSACTMDDVPLHMGGGARVTISSDAADETAVTAYTSLYDIFVFDPDRGATSIVGTAAIANHPAGIANLTFSNVDPVEVAQRTVLVRAGAVTFVHVEPTP